MTPLVGHSQVKFHEISALIRDRNAPAHKQPKQ